MGHPERRRRDGLFEGNSAVGFGAMQDGVNEDGTGRPFVEANAIVADAEAEFAGVSLELLMSPSPVRAKRSKAVRMRMAVSRSMPRTSVLACGVTTIFFTRRPTGVLRR
jgi:hypothetical protein